MTTRTKLINRRYRLDRRLTLTDSVETWLGFDNVLHRAVAITLPRQEVLRDLPFLDEFLQRSRIATALHHRGIVAAFDSGNDGGTPYLVTEYTGGEQLSRIIRAEAPFDVEDVSILVEQVAGALDYAHQRGFVHGALTASDVIVDGQGIAKLLGLGIPSGSQASRREVGPREPLSFDDDVQALAALAFEMLTGEAPDAVDPDSAGEVYEIAPDVSRNTSDIVSIGMGGGSSRFSSAGAFARALSNWRTFDPDEFYIIPAAPTLISNETGAVNLLPTPNISKPPTFPGFQTDAWFGDELLATEDSPALKRDSSSAVPMALVAVMLLALLAGVLVWRGSHATAEPSVVPPQIEMLAELGGF